MQLFEFGFLFIMALAIIRVMAGSRFGWLRYSYLTFAGLVILLAGLAIEGWRWQLLPAYLGFAFVALAAMKRTENKLFLRMLGALGLSVLVASAGFLAACMPIISLPEPSGQYGVGTFDFSITDPARIERYAPERKRELYVEVWYPAARETLNEAPVRTLFHELYEGDYNRNSFLFGYLEHVDTHSHVEARVAQSAEGKFPVLLFNHALDFGFTSQNQLLMEHLASHGYVIFSISHPYQSPKVNLAQAGSILRSSKVPDDISMPPADTLESILSPVFEATGDIRKVSELKSLLYPLAEKYFALADESRANFLREAVTAPEFEEFRPFVSEASLAGFIYNEYLKNGASMQYWVEDNQFIADSLASLQAPVAGFAEILDLKNLGVFGMSIGGAAAGEFCKLDRRCKAGTNLDGTQWGDHWDTKLPVPFLMFGNDEHQGGNDYAYMPAPADFWDYRIKGSSHMDFTDFVYLWPFLKVINFSGTVDGMRMMEIINTVQLAFFDHYLKGKAVSPTLATDFPEVVVRRFD